MDQLAPPSPSPSGHGDMLPPGFDHLIKHNATSYPGLMNDDPFVKMSQPGSRYGSPAPAPRFATPTPHSTYPPLEQISTPLAMTASHGYHTPTHSPPGYQPDWPATRGGRNFRQTPNRIQKPTPKKRSRAKAASGNAKASAITRPLSEAVDENPDVEVADIETFVNRSTETRMAEVNDVKSKSPGKIKRPMNAFMLYRKAYQNIAKRLCTQNNHQLVSQVCGTSWPLEPESLRGQFNEWARLERENHQKAHPDYKFTPAKPKPKEDDWHSGSEDGEWRPGRGAMREARWNGNHTNSRLRLVADAAVYDMYSPHGGTPMPQTSLGIHSPTPSMYHQFQDPGRPLSYQHDVYGTPHYYAGRVLDDGRLPRDTPSPAPSFPGGDLGNAFDLGNYPPLPGTGPTQFYTPQYGAPMQQQQHVQQQHVQHPVYQHYGQRALQHVPQRHILPSQQQQQQQHPQQHHPQQQHRHQQQQMIDPGLMGHDGEYDTSYPLNSAGAAAAAMDLADTLLAGDPSGDYLRGSNEDWQVELDTVDWEKHERRE